MFRSKHDEREEPDDWYGAVVLDAVPDEMFFAGPEPVLDRREMRHLARLIRGMTGDADL